MWKIISLKSIPRLVQKQIEKGLYRTIFKVAKTKRTPLRRKAGICQFLLPCVISIKFCWKKVQRKNFNMSETIDDQTRLDGTSKTRFDDHEMNRCYMTN